MIVCEKCGRIFSDDLDKCPACGTANPLFEAAESDEEVDREVDRMENEIEAHPAGPNPLEGRVDLDDELEQKSLVPVFRASNETVAMIVKGLLESEGIPVYTDSRMVPWLNGVMKSGEGYWGDLVVPESEADRSREIIGAYEEAARKEGGQGG